MEHLDRVALARVPGEVGTVCGWRGGGRRCLREEV